MQTPFFSPSPPLRTKIIKLELSWQGRAKAPKTLRENPFCSIKEFGKGPCHTNTDGGILGFLLHFGCAGFSLWHVGFL